MARRESFEKVALRTIAGTPFHNAEMYRVIVSTGVGEYVKIKEGKVVEFKREPHDDELFQKEVEEESLKVVKNSKRSRPREQNGLEYRGTVMIAGSPIDFYGSDKAWKKFLETEV